MSFLPSAKSKRWTTWCLLYALILWLLLVLDRFVLLGNEFSLPIMARLAVLALAVSVIVNSFGWFGAKLVWLITTAGLLIGLVLMFTYTYRDMSGWEDLAGFLAFAIFTAGGFAAGLIVEGIYLLIRQQRKQG
ncbi:hypothetical protein [Paenibacillus sp. BAC0078]